MKLSVVIVNYKVKELLAQAIRSLRKAEGYDQTEVIVVDNDSNDGSFEYISINFPEVIWIGLKTNAGFGKACNIGAERASAPVLLMLNPDTLVSSDTLVKGLDFLEKHPKAGIMSPKVLNQDGSFQWQCRRSFPTPSNAFFYLTGLYRLFPKSKKLGAYSMTWAPSDEAMKVDAVSGSCFFIPTDLYQEIGGFDESFFMYGEDLDICAQVTERGREVWYSPVTEIIHFKGKSSTQKKIATRVAFYKAMLIFSKKYKKSYGSFFPTGLISVGIWLQALLNMASIAAKQFPFLFFDAIIVNVFLAAAVFLRFSADGHEVPYGQDSLEIWGVHLLATLSFLLPIGFSGGYSKRNYGLKRGFTTIVGATVLYMALLFLFRHLAISRLALVSGAAVSGLFITFWRFGIPAVSRFYKTYLADHSKVVVLGSGNVLERVLAHLEDEGTVVRGIVQPNDEGDKTAELFGYPVVGQVNELPATLERFKPDMLVIASESDWYSTIIQYLSQGVLNGITIKWLPLPISSDDKIKLEEFTI